MPQKLHERVLSFASEIDELTIEQAKETAAMPFVAPHIALMPDAHFGKGSSVGTVIPTIGAVIPAAVGVDIGCVDADTQFFTGSGWKRIAEYVHGDNVLQYDPGTGIANLTAPQRYIVRDQESFYHLKTKYGVDQMLTPDHKMLIWQISGRNRERVQRVMPASEFVRYHEGLVQGFKAEFETSFRLPETYGIHWNPAVVRVHVMTSADATIDKGTAVLRLMKDRKIERAEKLLADAGISYSLGEGADGATIIRYRPTFAKGLEAFWSADPSTLSVVAEEVLHWDGNVEDRVFFTRRKVEADLVQFAFTASGFRSSMRADTHSRDGGTDYRVFRIDQTKVGMAGVPKSPIVEVPSADGKAYCFTVPTGFLVLRRNGNVFVTGNCGMIAARMDATWDRLRSSGRDDLAALRESVESAIPLSPGNYNKCFDRFDFTAARIAELEALGEDVDLSHSPKWREQLGSLGGGNHFIELCLDENQQVWLFLHSGSRGVGNKIAQKHIKVAQKLCKQWWIDLPNPDLAYLPQGTPEFVDYLRELHWAQKFALLNRAEMMDRFRRAFVYWMGGDVDNAHEHEVDRVNTHHNYTVMEHHFGRDVWLTRKGAIDAHDGVKGLIPGSMGTKSYVVTGKGNRAGLCSAPHGAGRRFSRNEAKKRFTEEDLAERMKGIEYRHGAEWIDEIPDAYKPIDSVMADAAELVTVNHELRQLLNVKGT